MKYSVQLGFGVIIFLIIASSGGVLYQIFNASSIVDELVSVSNAKIEHAQTMRNAILHRVISLNTMLNLDDPFARDEEIFRFFEHSRPYREARDRLRALPMTKQEKLLHERLSKHARASRPLSEHATDLVRENAPREQIVTALNAASVERAPMYVALDELVILQKQYGQEAQAKSRELYNETFWAIVIIAFLVIALSLSIATFVSHTVATKNRQLTGKNKELEAAYERAEAATKSKSAFLANMSHEIRTPITAIIGFAESSLLSGQTMEMRQKALNTIINSGKHLLQIINDVLDISKIEAKKLETEVLPTSVIQVMQDVELIMGPLAKEKGLEFELHYRYPLPDIINTDPLRFKQIILNLCSNAIKFTEKGHVSIDIAFIDKTSQIAVEVNDSGIGLDESQMDHVFKAFNQAEASTSRRFGGTGLGLPLSNELAIALGGCIEVDSTPGTGSCFRLLIDAGDINPDEFITNAEQIEVEIERSSSSLETERLSGRVLVVEDNAVNQHLLTLFLEKLSVDFDVVENGQLAINKAMTESFDLVLMDIQMPIMDGAEATKVLRKQNYDKPIIALTANVMSEDVEKYMNGGFDGHLSKPIDIEKFFEVLSCHLQADTTEEQQADEPIKSDVIEDDSRLLSVAMNYVRHYLPDAVLMIENSIESKIWSDLSNVLTQIKGSSGSLGYIELREVILKMEFQLLNKNQSELRLLTDELKSVYRRMAAGLNIALIDTDSSEHVIGQSGF